MSHTLDHLLEPFAAWLDDDAVEDVCVQEEGAVWVYSRGKFTRHPLLVTDLNTGEMIPVDAAMIEDLAIVAAAQREQDVGNGRPLLRTDLLGRGRLQVILPPNALFPTFAIRRGSDEWPTLSGLVASGLFKKTRKQRAKGPIDAEMVAYYEADDWENLLNRAVRTKKNIVIAGPNGSGKTHLSKALIGEIPEEERLITIESAAELRGLRHPNRVQLFYDADDPDSPKPSDLVEAALRLRIGRLFLQELLSGEDVLAYLIAGQAGHGGSITSIHAPSCSAVFERMRVLIKRAIGGAAISDADITNELHAMVDVVVHFADRDLDGFSVDEVMLIP